MTSRLITTAMRLFFRLLYHPFSWAYDLVAAAVSMGRWNQWVLSAAPLLQGSQILELGFGPGHLQTHLHKAGMQTYGLDESWQMARQARRSLRRQGHTPQLARALAQRLPYAAGAFHSVVATFPTPYIVDPATLAEVRRVLAPGGRLVVLMSVWIVGERLHDRALRSLYGVTAQSPLEGQELMDFLIPYQQAGFQASLRFVEPRGARLMFIIAQKPAGPAPRQSDTTLRA